MARLIDADALKEKFSNMYRDDYEKWIKAIIDNAPTLNDQAYAIGYIAGSMEGYKKGIEDARPTGNPVIKCKDCKYQEKEWREDKRMKEKGYWVYGCKYFGELMGYWGFGGNDNEFCSEAEQEAENDSDS